MSYWDVEMHAAALRRVMGVGLTDWLEPAELFARMDRVTVFGEPLVYRIDDGISAEGLTRHDNEEGRYEIVMPTTTYEGILDGNARDLFTIGHEFGHVVLHSRVLRSRDLHNARVALARQSPHPAYADTEWQANAFAGAFLAPAPLMWRALAGESVRIQLSQQAQEVRRGATRKRLTVLLGAANLGWMQAREWETPNDFAAMVPQKETPSFHARRKTAF